jgi:predicted nucleic acid-binding protein
MSVFVDTSALYAALAEDDRDHTVAVELLERLRGSDELVTHNYIHVEVEALVRRRLGTAAAATLVELVLPALTTIWVDEPTHAAALDALRLGGRAASLVDEVSFIVMRRLGIRRALTFDRDFEREGFRLVEPPAQGPEHRISEERAPYGMDQPSETGLVGVAEIAARSGYSTNTVQSWRRRHRTFPKPTANLASGPVWGWSSVADWIGAERRTPRQRLVDQASS